MERIRDAINRAKEQRDLGSHPNLAGSSAARATAFQKPVTSSASLGLDELQLRSTSPAILENNRILASQRGNPYSIAFDMLRTKVAQEMEANRWQTLIITSPTAGCGKTVTAINLALSLSRQPEKQIFLLDLDLRKPRIASSLGIAPRRELLDVLNGRVDLSEALFGIDIAAGNLAVLAATKPAEKPSETLVSRQTQELLAQIRSYSSEAMVIIDTPPVLLSDDVLAFLPYVDCCALTVAEGQTSIREVESCQKLLSGANLLGCILTKSSEKIQSYY